MNNETETRQGDRTGDERGERIKRERDRRAWRAMREIDRVRARDTGARRE